VNNVAWCQIVHNVGRLVNGTCERDTAVVFDDLARQSAAKVDAGNRLELRLQRHHLGQRRAGVGYAHLQ
jgi:hypothetical protein